MSYSNCFALVATSLLLEEIEQQIEELWEQQKLQLVASVADLLRGEVTPEINFQFEEELQKTLNEIGRLLTQFAYNHLEDDPHALPKHVWFEGGFYRRLNQKTRNQHVANRFGKIVLWRFAYRDDQTGDRCVFPLEIALGLVEGATPALADRVARYMAETGATQRRGLERLKQDHGVNWGVKRLRNFTRLQAERMDAFRHQMQVARVLELLEEARKSKGKCKPVLSVGRDGITLCSQPHSFWEVATAATITVYDRRGKRLGTVYLGYPPELGQHTMSEQLTRLIRDILTAWEGPLPRLCYVTDAGASETEYYRTVLRRMKHPRTDSRLSWYRIIDYYHAAERITTMSEKLFGKGTRECQSWSRRMRKLLLKPNGPYRVLHSAAALLSRRELSESAQEDFDRAYNYIRRRTKFMDYAGYRNLHLPIGSGVTEAACKTLFTERLKLSGMRWKQAGASSILKLRVIHLSGIWEAVREAMLQSDTEGLPRPHASNSKAAFATAA